jgi:uncharacterized protein
MLVPTQKKPLIQKGIWRAVLFFIAYVLTISLTSVIALMAMKGTTVEALQEAQEAFKKPPLLYIIVIATAVASIVSVWAFSKLVDRQSVFLGRFPVKHSVTNGGIGFFTGLLILCAGTLLLYYHKNLQWEGIQWNTQQVLIGVGFMIIIALSEELVFRGYILHNLLESTNKWIAWVLSAALFAMMHSFNPHINVVSLTNIFLSGLLLGINYLHTKNLWYAFFLHFSWNFFQGPILGYNVSGLTTESVLTMNLQGDPLLTGGDFGFENSIVASVLLSFFVVLYAAVYSYQYKPKYISATVY